MLLINLFLSYEVHLSETIAMGQSTRGHGPVCYSRPAAVAQLL
jgi:hypothetical protein